MSRIGIRPIKIEEGVLVEITPSRVITKKDQSQMELEIPTGITVKQDSGNLFVTRKDDSKDLRSKHGLIARLLKNIITGVNGGFTRELEFKGTGYRASVNGEILTLNMGYSHEINITIPADITVAVKKNIILLSGMDKEKIGGLASKIREVRPPEVYKGKGIKYKEELIRRKAGKKAAS
ncbi:MAG: 50S ribosomal protein L6 [Patescibacteria group bacterium]